MITFKPLSNPLLIVGDNPAMFGGLARSGRDIATLACTLPQFRVGYLARGIGNNRNFPFTVYSYPESGQWGELYIKQVWEEFSNGEPGVILTTDDLTRRHWFANPVGLPADLATFLGSGRNYHKWAYVPLDSVGPNGSTLTSAGRDCAVRYDRVLAASEWANGVFHATGVASDWLPHGLWLDKFHPIDKAPEIMGWNDHYVVGCVMANQARKDFPAAFECFACLKAHYGNQFRAWLHTDALINYWNIYALATDYDLGDCLEITTTCNDDQLAARYSACDCTILPTAGEGFGFPIAESLACGTACVTTNYAAGAELVPEACRVQPITYKVETQHNCVRAVLSGRTFANAVYGQIEEKQRDWEYRSGQLAETVAHLDWNKLRHLWERWLLDGLR